MGGLFIGDLAREADVPIQTVRYYERRGLIAPPPGTPAESRLPTGCQEMAVGLRKVVTSCERAEPMGACPLLSTLRNSASG
jgi:MerR family regulatory protein